MFNLRNLVRLLTATTLAIAAHTASAAAPVYAGYPAPGGNAATPTGSPDGAGGAGGTTWALSGFTPSAYGDLYFVIGTTPSFTADGSTDTLTFDAGVSDLANGIAIWSGSTTVPTSSGPHHTLFTRFRLTTKDTSNSALALDPPASYGLPVGAGPSLKVNSNFNATYEFLASTTFAGTYTAALPVYNLLPSKSGSAGDVVSSVGGAFYATAPVPEPETYALLLAGLGMIGGILRRRALK